MSTLDIDDIEQRLFAIDSQKFIEAVAMLQRVENPAILAIMDRLRPRLAKVRPHRPPSVKRLLCVPLEPLFYSADGCENRPGRVWRGVIGPCWQLIGSELGRPRIEELAEELKALPPRDFAARDQLSEKIWRLGAEALTARLQATTLRAKRKAFFDGDALMRRQAETVAQTLAIATPLQQLRDRLPDGQIKVLSKEDSDAIGQAIVAASAAGDEGPLSLLRALALRLETPGILLDALRPMELVKIDKKHLLAALGGEIVADLRSQCQFGIGGGPASGVRLACRIADSLPQTETVAVTAKDLQRQCMALRKDAGDLVKREVLEGAEQQVELALPKSRKEVDITVMTAAETRLRALKSCNRIADELGVGQDLKKRLLKVQKEINLHADDVFEDIRRKVGDMTADSARTSLYGAVRLVELADGPQAADKLRQEGLSLIKARFYKP